MTEQLFESKFKAGDKVRVLNHPTITLIGEIVTLRQQYCYFLPELKYDKYWMVEEHQETADSVEWVFRDEALELVDQ